MIGLQLPAVRRILVLGAHSDDIEIGCGGTILRLTRELRDLTVKWVVFSADAARRREAIASANSFLGRRVRKEIVTMEFRGSYFPYEGREIKDFMETLKPFEPDLVLTHYRDDRHQDHRTVSDLTWNTFRNHLVLEYEIPKYDGDLGIPNAFVHLSKADAERKVRSLCRHFQTQSNKHWFTEDTFLGLMRLRGVESAAASGFAEAFFARKTVIVPR